MWRITELLVIDSLPSHLHRENISLFLLFVTNTTTTTTTRGSKHRFTQETRSSKSNLVFASHAWKLYPRHLDVIRQSLRPGAPPSPLQNPGSLSPVEPVSTTLFHIPIILQSYNTVLLLYTTQRITGGYCTQKLRQDHAAECFGGDSQGRSCYKKGMCWAPSWAQAIVHSLTHLSVHMIR